MKLVLIHGIWNYKLEKDFIYKKWVTNLKKGLVAAGLDPQKLDAINIDLVYYGDLYENFRASIAVGSDQGAHDLAEDLATQIDTTEVDKAKISGPLDLIFKRFVKIIQGKFPFIDETFLKIIAKESHLYFTNKEYCKAVSIKFLNSINAPKQEVVVVGHSLGSVIAYDLLVNTSHHSVKKLITLGSPLAVKYFQKLIKVRHPIEMPKSIKNGQWFNGIGKEDFVSLYPLDENRFKTKPKITNKTVITDDKHPHNISGYLSNPAVAKEIYLSLGL